MGSSSAVPGAVLAVDLGLRRTGLAGSDPERRIAFGLPTFENRHGRSLKAHLSTLQTQTHFVGIVIGLPRHMDGRLSDLAASVHRLGRWAESELKVRVAYWDERLTSEEAAEWVAEAPKAMRREKGLRDRLAAQIILREFLAAGCPFPSLDSDRDFDPDSDPDPDPDPDSNPDAGSDSGSDLGPGPDQGPKTGSIE